LRSSKEKIRDPRHLISFIRLGLGERGGSEKKKIPGERGIKTLKLRNQPPWKPSSPKRGNSESAIKGIKMGKRVVLKRSEERKTTKLKQTTENAGT